MKCLEKTLSYRLKDVDEWRVPINNDKIKCKEELRISEDLKTLKVGAQHFGLVISQQQQPPLF